MKWLDLVQ